MEMKLPKALKTTPQLLAAAAAMGGAASKHVATFIAAGMSTDFIAELEAAAEAFKTGATVKGSVSSTQIGATGALKESTKQARKVVKQLDALVEPLLANNTSLLTKWKATKRFSGRTQAIASEMTSSAGTTSVVGAGPGVPAPAVGAVGA
jgi:NAD-dependent DNA ligase